MATLSDPFALGAPIFAGDLALSAMASARRERAISKPFNDPYLWLCLPPVLTISVVTYVILGVKGPAWATGAIDTIVLACFFLHIFGYLNGLLGYKQIVLLASVVLTVAYLMAFALSTIMCFRGDSRFDNCGFENFVILAFVNAGVLLACNFDLVRQIALASVVSFPLLTISAHGYLTAPLYWELFTKDLTRNCYVQLPARLYAPARGQRILHPWDVRTGLIVGENSLRIYKVSGTKAFVWKYSRRQFKPAGLPTAATANCAQDYVG